MVATIATYRSMSPSSAADAYADQQSEEDRREQYVEQAAYWLAKSWERSWDKIIEVICEADADHSKYVGMAIATIIDKQNKHSTIGKGMLARAVGDLLYREAEKQVRKELKKNECANSDI